MRESKSINLARLFNKIILNATQEGILRQAQAARDAYTASIGKLRVSTDGMIIVESERRTWRLEAASLIRKWNCYHPTRYEITYSGRVYLAWLDAGNRPTGPDPTDWQNREWPEVELWLRTDGGTTLTALTGKPASLYPLVESTGGRLWFSTSSHHLIWREARE